MKNYSKRKNEVWLKGKSIPGKDPSLYRLDKCGNEMYYYSYGKDSSMGWHIDHSKPQSKGGTHHLNNLQPLNSRANKQKGNKHPHTCQKIGHVEQTGFPWKTCLAVIGALILLR